MRQLTLSILISGMFLSASAATLTHEYDLTNSLADTIGTDDLNSDGGTIGATGYSFGAGQGLNLGNALSDAGNYSILMDFSFTDLDGFRKILDFKDLASDDGLYNLANHLNFFNFATSSSVDFSPNTLARVVLTRDSTTDVVSGYVDGALVLSFTDSSSAGVFSATNDLIRFFEDDNVTSSHEASAGLATEIQIYDGALSSADVTALGGPGSGTSTVPEPSTFAFLAAGIAGLVLAARRRESPPADKELYR